MGTEVKKAEKTRPYWHVDAKWISGLLFMFVLGLSLFTFGLFTVTNEKNGIETMTKMIALGFSRDGLDSTKDMEKLKAKIETSPTKSFKPNPGLNITLTKSDIEGKTPREIRLMIFKQVAIPIYFNGRGAENVLNTPEARANFEKDATLLRLFSENSHKFIGRFLIALSSLTIILAAFVIFFSYRFGRFANPGFNIVLAALPWAGIFTGFSLIAKNFTGESLSLGMENGGYGAMIGPFVREVIPGLASVFSRTYFIAAIFGLGLLIVAGICKLFLRKKKESLV